MTPPPAATSTEAPAAAAPATPADPGRPAIFSVLLAALLLRLWRLGAQSVWTDEATTWTSASSPIGILIERCATRDASPPLFYLLTALALKLGDNEATLRLVSVLASTGLVYLTYRIARLAAPRPTATLAAAITALSPFQLMYAQEARTYALVGFFTVLALYLFARAAVLGRRRAWLPFVGATVLGFYTQSIALLGVGVQATMLLVSRAARLRGPTWALAVGAAILVYAPWLLASLAQASHLTSSHWYIKPPRAHTVVQVLRAVFLAPFSLVTAAGPTSAMPGLDRFMPAILAHATLILAPALPLVASLQRMDDPGDRGRIARFCLVALGVPLAVVFAVSFVRPLWLPRYFVLLTPMLAVLLALGLETIRPRAVAVGWSALLLLVLGYSDFRYFTDYTKERWRDVEAIVARDSDPDGAAVIVPFDTDPYDYYNRRRARPLTVVPYAHPDVPFHDTWSARQHEEMYAEVIRRTASAGDVWVVVRSPNSPERKRIAILADSAASIGRALVMRDSLDSSQGKLRIRHFRRIAAVGPTELRAR